MKKILCLDFDGVLHSYTSPYEGPHVVRDAPVDGAMDFLWKTTEHFRVCIYSSRSGQKGGIAAMQKWLRTHFMDFWGAHPVEADDKLSSIEWPTTKPAAFLTIDDRAIQFTGVFPEIESLKTFKPWNKK